jgi:hypothetical protein
LKGNIMATLNTRKPGDSNTTISPANPSGTKGPGNISQYGNGGTLTGSNQITPAGPYISAGTNNSIIGTVPPGKDGIPQVRTVIQNPTAFDRGCGGIPT